MAMSCEKSRPFNGIFWSAVVGMVSLWVEVVVSTVTAAAATSTAVVCCPTASVTGTVKTLPAVTLIQETVDCWNPLAVTVTL